MIQYGLISRVDSNAMEKVFDLLIEQFPNETINYTECGLYNGRTTSGVNEYLKSKGVEYNLTGIDNFKDKEELVFYPANAKLIQGSSIEVYNQLPDNSQHFIMIDANHTFPYVIADTYCYMSKVKVGGILMYHDAAPHAQNKSWQRMGNEADEDMNISVLKALRKIGLIGNEEVQEYLGFKPLFHEWASFDIDEGGGTVCFRRIK